MGYMPPPRRRPVAMRQTLPLALAALLLLAGAVAAPAAAQPADQVDECRNAELGPGEDGPPGFVGSLVPDFLSDLFASLPVPNFVKALFGAPTC